MAWTAMTIHGELNSCTELGIFHQPWDPHAELPEQLPSGVQLTIDFPNHAAAAVTVLSVTGTEAIIETSDQVRWLMVRVGPKELKFPPPIPAAPWPRIGS
jgi:hypothetical protein